MSRFDSFEDMEVWQKARELTRDLYAISNQGRFSRDFGLREQVRRAAVSIVSNIAEGFERRGDREFARFLSVAKGSAGEVRAQLYVALDLGYLSRTEFDRLSAASVEISRMVSSLITYLRRTAK
jgi:four helix bundle protein